MAQISKNEKLTRHDRLAKNKAKKTKKIFFQFRKNKKINNQK
jgi:hypothetical protein